MADNTRRLIPVARIFQGPTPAQAIENVLSNPAQLLRLSKLAFAHEPNPRGGNVWLADSFLAELKRAIDTAGTWIESLTQQQGQRGRASLGADERVQVRKITAELDAWITVCVLERGVSTEPDRPLTVPDEVEAKLHELARLGRMLRMVWQDVEGSTTAPADDGAKQADRTVSSGAGAAARSRPERKPLSDVARAVYAILCELPETEGRTAKELVRDLADRRVTVGGEEHIRDEIRRELLPYGLQNSRGGRGYYIPMSDRPSELPAH